MSCFFSHAGRTAIPALLSVALAAAACNKDGEITLPDSKPRITLDSETGVYAAKIGRAVTITPTVENEGEAAYSWTIDDEVVSTARVFEYVFNEEGRVYVILRVENRAGYDEKEARIDVNRLAPPVISLIVPPTGLYVLTGREYTFAPEVQNGENARYEWYLDDSSVPVSTEKDYIFMRTQPGDCSLRLTVTNEDGTAEKTVAVHVVDVIPVRIAFIPSSYLGRPAGAERIARTDAVPAAAGERRRRAGICMVRERRLAGGRNPTHVRLHAGERGRIRSHLPGDGHGRKPGRTPLAPHHARIVEANHRKNAPGDLLRTRIGARHHDDGTARVEPGARIPARARTVRQRNGHGRIHRSEELRGGPSLRREPAEKG